MIGYLKGQILGVEDGRIVLGIGSAQLGWVGYSISIPRRSAYQTFLPGESAEFFIYTHVREDALDLFGFIDAAEKELFLVLTSVSGIGPRTGLGILSQVEPSRLFSLILEGDSPGLTKLPGIGKKTSERMILELSDSLKKRVRNGEFSSLVDRTDSKRDIEENGKAAGAHSGKLERALQDATAALVGLGYRESDAARVLSEVLAGDSPPQTTEALIRAVLRQQVI